jgi:hypothetical protein
MPHISRLWMCSLRDSTDADYLLYGTMSGSYGATNAERALMLGQFEKMAERPGLVLLRRKGLAPAPPVPSSGSGTAPPSGAAAPAAPPPAR